MILKNVLSQHPTNFWQKKNFTEGLCRLENYWYFEAKLYEKQVFKKFNGVQFR